MSKEMNYAKFDFKRHQHHGRLKRFIAAMPRKLTCQECGGSGGYTEVVCPELGGPWVECGWCEGLGLVTPHARGLWLKYNRRPSRGAA